MSLLASLVAPVLLLALGGAEFAREFPRSRRSVGASGQLTHASGFRANFPGKTAEQKARAFLAKHADAFGTGGSYELILRSASPKLGEPLPLRFQRFYQKLPVLH